MIKQMKNIEIVQVINGLSEFVNKDKTIPVMVSYAISKNLNEMRTKIEPFEEERKKIISKKKDASVSEQESINDDFKELCEIEVPVDVKTVSMEQIENIDMSTKDFFSMEFMIEE